MEKSKIAETDEHSMDPRIERSIKQIAQRAAEFIETASIALAAGKEATDAAETFDELARNLSTEQYVSSWTMASNSALVASGMIGAYAATNLGVSDEDFEGYLGIAKQVFEDTARSTLEALREEDLSNGLVVTGIKPTVPPSDG